MSISAKLLAESYKEFNVKAVTKDSDGGVTLWSSTDGLDKVIVDDICSWQQDDYMLNVSIGKLEITEFIGKEPKDCIYVVEEPIDYEKWENCLVWFWNYEKCPICPPVAKFKEERYGRFIVQYEGNCIQVNHCRPVRRDEVQFVEDEE